MTHDFEKSFIHTNPDPKSEAPLGEETLSECKDKELRASQEFWQERVERVGTHKSPYLHTPPERIEVFTKRFESLIREHVANKDVLEIGCGYGRNIKAFSNCHQYVGIDFIPELIDEAKKNAIPSKVRHVGGAFYPQFSFKCMNLRDLEPGMHKFDIVVGVSVITSVEYEFPKVLDTLKAVLKPGGYILWLEEEWYRIDWKDC